MTQHGRQKYSLDMSGDSRIRCGSLIPRGQRESLNQVVETPSLRLLAREQVKNPTARQP